MKATIVATVLFVASVASPAFADCAGDLTKIDEAMKSATLDEASMTKAKEALEKAKAAQAANDEATCTTSTKEVLAMLGQ
jgi:hypothetical protein